MYATISNFGITNVGCSNDYSQSDGHFGWSMLLITKIVLNFLTDETANPTPDGTPVSDGSTDSPVTDTHSVHFSSSSLNEQPRPASPVKRAVRSLSWDPSTMTQTRLQILSRVRSVRENIRSQISNSSPSSPSSRSM